MVLAYLPVWAEMIVWLAGLIKQAWLSSKCRLAALYCGAFLVTLGGHWLAAALLVLWLLPGMTLKNPAGYNYSELVPFLDYPRAGYQELILADLFDGPEIAYKSGYGVLGAPYHEDQGGGNELTYKLFGADPDLLAIQQQFRQKHIRYIIMPKVLFQRYQKFVMSPVTLLGRLARGREPQWLTRVPLPVELSQRCLLFQVKPLRE